MLYKFRRDCSRLRDYGSEPASVDTAERSLETFPRGTAKPGTSIGTSVDTSCSESAAVQQTAEAQVEG